MVKSSVEIEPTGTANLTVLHFCVCVCVCVYIYICVCVCVCVCVCIYIFVLKRFWIWLSLRHPWFWGTETPRNCLTNSPWHFPWHFFCRFPHWESSVFNCTHNSTNCSYTMFHTFVTQLIKLECVTAEMQCTLYPQHQGLSMWVMQVPFKLLCCVGSL